MPDVSDREASVYRVVRLLLDADIREDDRRYFLDLALWRLTEFDKNRHKFAVRYRTATVMSPERHEINHEHVVPRRWLLDRILARPHDAERFLKLAVAWERYVNAGVTVIDTAAGMSELNLAAAAAEQRDQLVQLQEAPSPG